MTLRLTDEEFDLALKPDVKSREEGGHWRMVFWIHPAHHDCILRYKPGVIARFHGDEWMFLFPHPTDADADARGRSLEAYARRIGVGEVMQYRRAEFFPDYPSGGA